MLEEEQLNGRIASVINALTKSAGWLTREETWEVLRGPRTKPDVLITRADGPPIVLENEYAPAPTVAADCLRVIGRELDPEVAGTTGRVGVVIAIRSTDELQQCDTGDDAQRLLESGHEIGYAVYQGDENRHIRFPEAGFIRGNIRDLVAFIRPAAVPQDTIDAATESFEYGVADGAAAIMDCARQYQNLGQRIAIELRQQWPAWPAHPPATAEVAQQERIDQNARQQTAKMTAAMLINALAYQQNLAGYSGEVEINGRKETRTIKGIGEIRKPTGLHPDDVIREWDNILSINYWPIFHIARKLLRIIPPIPATRMLNMLEGRANAIQDAIKQNDVAGTVFQRLITDRQTLATYYTRPESTVLTACLAIPDNLDWADPETLKNYRIADYACGSGGLVLAAYQRARELHRNHGGNPENLHGYMMENSITACDIMPAAVHLTTTLLSSVSPRELYNGTRNVLYPYGGTGEVDNRGRPIVELGSLELLDINATKFQAVLPLNEQMAMGAMEERSPIEVEMTPLSQSLVIMNPPFTTPTNNAADHAKPGNPAFAAFNTTLAEQKAMADKTKRLSRGTIGDGYAGLGSQFTAIAHNMVKPNGHIALILPLSAMIGGSYDDGVARSWQKLRRLLADNYNDIIVVSIAQWADRNASFSADTDLAEVIIVARRLCQDESPQRTAHFVNLNQRPSDKLTAQETAKALHRTIAGLDAPETYDIATVGNDPIATVLLERIDPLEKWPAVRILNMELLRAAKELARGNLLFPRYRNPIEIPVAPMRDLGNTGPVDRLFAAAFTRQSGANRGTAWPMLWSRDKEKQLQMAALPDSSGRIRRGQNDAAHNLWERVSNLHISKECRFNANPTCAVFTQQKSAGGRSWPNFQMETPEMEKAMCVWLNGTLGFISYWIESNRSQSGRGGTTVTAIPNIPALDVARLGAERLQAAVKIYDDLCEQRMLPANESYRDPVRKELDRRLLTEVLGLDDAAVEQLAILRYQWCREPTVTGTKNTGPAD